MGPAVSDRCHAIPFQSCSYCYHLFLFVLGLIVYFCYGYSHSVEAVRPSESSETQFILSQTPDFGKEVEEYPSHSASG